MENKTERIPVMLNPSDKQIIKAAAVKDGRSLSSFMLKAALDAARREQDG